MASSSKGSTSVMRSSPSLPNRPERRAWSTITWMLIIFRQTVQLFPPSRRLCCSFKIVVESMHEIGCDRRTPPFGSCPEKERNRVAATDVIQVVRWEPVQVHDIGGRIEPWGQIGVVSPPDWTIVDPDNIPCEAAFLESHLAGLTAHASNDWWS